MVLQEHDTLLSKNFFRSFMPYKGSHPYYGGWERKFHEGVPRGMGLPPAPPSGEYGGESAMEAARRLRLERQRLAEVSVWRERDERHRWEETQSQDWWRNDGETLHEPRPFHADGSYKVEPQNDAEVAEPEEENPYAHPDEWYLQSQDKREEIADEWMDQPTRQGNLITSEKMGHSKARRAGNLGYGYSGSGDQRWRHRTTERRAHERGYEPMLRGTLEELPGDDNQERIEGEPWWQSKAWQNARKRAPDRLHEEPAIRPESLPRYRGPGLPWEKNSGTSV